MLKRLYDRISKVLGMVKSLDLNYLKWKGDLLGLDYSPEIKEKLLLLLMQRYFPFPSNYTLTSLKSKLLPNSREDVLSLLPIEHKPGVICLGEALRFNGYYDSPFSRSQFQVPDYNLTTLAWICNDISLDLEETEFTKSLLLDSLEETLAWQYLFIPMSKLRGDLVIISTSSKSKYTHEITSSLNQREVRLEVPANFRFTQKGLHKIRLYLDADIAVATFLWKWLRQLICPHHDLVISSLSYEDIISLYQLHNLVDVFLLPFPDILKNVIGNILVNWYFALMPSQVPAFLQIYQDERNKLWCLLAESLYSNGRLNLDLVNTKLKIHYNLISSIEIRRKENGL